MLVAATATFDPDDGLDLTDGTLTVTGNASFGSCLSVTGAGSFTVDGTLSSDNGSIYATDSSRVEIDALNGMSGGVTLNADATSTIEIGDQDVGAAGSITIDSAFCSPSSEPSKRLSLSSMARSRSRPTRSSSFTEPRAAD